MQTVSNPGTLPASHFEVLLAVLRTVAAHRNLPELFRALVTALGAAVDLQSIAVILYDEETHSSRLFALESLGKIYEPPPKPFLPEETPLWHVLQSQAPLVIPSVEEETRFPRLMELFRSLNIRSHCSFPLTRGERRLGALGINSEHQDAFSPELVRLLSLVADQIALAVGDALALELSQQAEIESQEACERMKLVLDVNNDIAANLEIRALLRAISANIRRVMRCDLVTVALPDADGIYLRISAFDFPDSKGFFSEETAIPIEKGVLGRVFRTRQPFITGLSDEKFKEDEADNPEELKSACILPLVSRDRVLGVLALARREEIAFTSCDVGFMLQIARQVALAVENALAYGEIAELKEQLAQEKLYLEHEIRSEMNFKEIVGQSTPIRRVLRAVETVATSDSIVLILGETGTGKELIARAIHDLSARRGKPFVKLNCAAIPTGLLESELFGHEKGAFTGAISQYIGRFELANAGTVFLDEIGDIPLELQPKLLRVLQEKEFERLGSTRTLRSDARLIAATNRDLESMVDEGKFRADLFYRLHVFPIRLPPLRERREDIPLLVRHFAEQCARRMNKRIETISSQSMKALVHYYWPGNIRELQNVIERAVILSTGKVLRIPVGELKRVANSQRQRSAAPLASNPTPIRSVLEDTERQQIVSVLEETNWVVGGPSGAAARLGMKRSTLQFRIQKLGIERNGHSVKP
jgi:formate hydrogenlyase transcriptional activator